MYDFASILLSGPCNLRCPYCIGKMLDPLRMPSNLHEFPLKGLEQFLRRVNEEGITQLSITGTNTDPQLYGFEEELLAFIRSRTGEKVQISLHTNGHLVLKNLHAFNSYDRAAISFPSFKRETCRLMTGSSRVVDLESILRLSEIPIKISTVISEHNIPEIEDHLGALKDLGIRRVVLRKLYGDRVIQNPLKDFAPRRYLMNNPIYDYGGMEVAFWHFESTRASCLNLFSSGEITESYLLERRVVNG
jgi:molybdenum cofactor biosynthesis enzyme MoaA